MIKTNHAFKRKKGVFLTVSFIGLSFLLVGAVVAQTVPQQVGFKDVAFSSLDKKGCQECHGESLVDAHHNTSQAVSGDCAACHSVSTEPGKVGVALQRDCMVCHTTSPHHATEAAANNECGSCHDSPGISDFSTAAPSYGISKVTPTVSNCRNCHGEGTVDGVQVFNPEKTHHGISLKGCNVCHEEGVDKKDTTIRACERCHSVKAIHEVLGHVGKDACAGCHGGKK